jgi:hypothetical protein
MMSRPPNVVALLAGVRKVGLGAILECVEDCGSAVEGASGHPAGRFIAMFQVSILPISDIMSS